MSAKIVNLRERSNSIQLTPEEALKDSLACSSEFDEVIILAHEREGGLFFWQGGSISSERVLWNLEQYKAALLEGRIELQE